MDFSWCKTLRVENCCVFRQVGMGLGLQLTHLEKKIPAF